MAQTLTSIDPLLPLLRERPLGVLSDIDGTLAPIVPRPEDAAVPEETRALLRGLVEKGVRVALVTGRSLESALQIAGVEGIAFAAEHGLRLWIDGRLEAAPGLAEYEALAGQAQAELRQTERAVSGVQVENKGPLLAVHYRRAKEPRAAREAVLEAVGRSTAARRFRLHEGRMVVELRPPLDVDKGTAAVTLIERLGLRGVLCLGDDITDIDMFAAAGRKRSQGLAAVTVAVVSEEATPELLRAADYSLEGTEGVRWLLAEMLRALP
ncbi:MAG: trehalose-phosphatase [Dehalococcoidia bacterium]|nr:trehalose-phosphatase [Dehalococcoidia bacterium]